MIIHGIYLYAERERERERERDGEKQLLFVARKGASGRSAEEGQVSEAAKRIKSTVNDFRCNSEAVAQLWFSSQLQNASCFFFHNTKSNRIFFETHNFRGLRPIHLRCRRAE